MHVHCGSALLRAFVLDFKGLISFVCLFQNEYMYVMYCHQGAHGRLGDRRFGDSRVKLRLGLVRVGLRSATQMVCRPYVVQRHQQSFLCCYYC